MTPREEALKAAYEVLDAARDAALAALATAEDAAYVAYAAEVARINKEYPQ